MSWSLQIKTGDLNLSGPEGYAVVRGPQKLVQDLRNWLLEKRGSDPLHPQYGSILDGGMTRGIAIDSFIGSAITQEVLLDIEAEIRRVLAAYQIQQSDRMRSDVINYGGRHTFDHNEILESVQNLTIRQINDVVAVRITLATSSGRIINLIQPVV